MITKEGYTTSFEKMRCEMTELEKSWPTPYQKRVVLVSTTQKQLKQQLFFSVYSIAAWFQGGDKDSGGFLAMAVLKNDIIA
jgi:hypothetical protein